MKIIFFIIKNMTKNNKKIIMLISILIALFTIGIVNKSFQNDTFFNIAIGKNLIENGIDMKEHFCWVDEDLDYTHSHWIFDIITYLIYDISGFTGIYVSTIIFSIITSITLFILLAKRSNCTVVSFFVTLLSIYIVKDAFTARSQIVSFLCFIIEIYCIEQFIETNKIRYPVAIFILSVVIANFHAATWPLVLVLFMPYVAPGILKIFSSKNIYKMCIKRLEKKAKKSSISSEKLESYNKDIEYYKKLISEPKGKYVDYKIVSKENYNLRNLIILMIIISFTGLLTPIHGTPYTYIIKSMFGESNFENAASIDYISEMQPTIPIANLAFITFSILFFAFLAFLPEKIRQEHLFLILGLYLMALCSARYTYLLVFLGAYVLTDLMVKNTNLLIDDDIKILEKIIVHPIGFSIVFILIAIVTTNNLLEKRDVPYVNPKLYPTSAVEFIKNNLDYKNIRIYNSYNNGSYLMLHEVPNFIDSRLDVYCSEFADTDIFYDFVQISNMTDYYENVFEKYDFTHILLQTSENLNNYIAQDANYKILYEDEFYVLYERTITK